MGELKISNILLYVSLFLFLSSTTTYCAIEIPSDLYLLNDALGYDWELNNGFSVLCDNRGIGCNYEKTTILVLHLFPPITPVVLPILSNFSGLKQLSIDENIILDDGFWSNTLPSLENLVILKLENQIESVPSDFGSEFPSPLEVLYMNRVAFDIPASLFGPSNSIKHLYITFVSNVSLPLIQTENDALETLFFTKTTDISFTFDQFYLFSNLKNLKFSDTTGVVNLNSTFPLTLSSCEKLETFTLESGWFDPSSILIFSFESTNYLQRIELDSMYLQYLTYPGIKLSQSNLYSPDLYIMNGSENDDYPNINFNPFKVYGLEKNDENTLRDLIYPNNNLTSYIYYPLSLAFISAPDMTTVNGSGYNLTDYAGYVVIDGLLTTTPYFLPGTDKNYFYISPNYFFTMDMKLIAYTPAPSLSYLEPIYGFIRFDSYTYICEDQDNGKCHDGRLICNDRYTGYNCESQKVNNINPPTFSDSAPQVTANSSVQLSTGDFASFTSLIELYSLTEYDSLNSRKIKIIQLSDLIWTRAYIQSTDQYQYTTAIATEFSNFVTNITVTTKYYQTREYQSYGVDPENTLVMNPSTINFDFEITDYPFNATYCRLILTLNTEFIRSDLNGPTCATLVYGQDFSTTNHEYVKWQIGDFAYYAKLPRIGIYDSWTEAHVTYTITEPVADLAANTSVGRVGINIPFFQKSFRISTSFYPLYDESTQPALISRCADFTPKQNGLSRNEIYSVIFGISGFCLIIIITVLAYVNRRKLFMETI